ncbi:MAG: DUF4292 domain-containing protein [Muribaculaceae bacterium]|nr:DUF4292 domain-containing protein [Muribaculaceae bacterium]
MKFRSAYSKISIYIVIGVMACFMVSCGSSKKATRNVPGEEVTGTDTPYGRMISTYNAWESVSMGIKVRLESPYSFSVSGKAYMENSEAIHVSLRVLGFEVGVFHVNRDSVCVVDKLHRVVVTESMEKFRAYTGLDLVQLQDILLGRWIEPEAPGGIVIRGLKYSYTMNGEVDQLASLDVELSSGKKIECKYTDWEKCSVGWAPSSISTEIGVSGHRFKGAISYTPSSISLDRHDMPSFKFPEGYRNVSVEEFLKTLKTI